MWIATELRLPKKGITSIETLSWVLAPNETKVKKLKIETY
jgi:hypothetical protein